MNASQFADIQPYLSASAFKTVSKITTNRTCFKQFVSVKPTKTLTISLTGDRCEQKCAHCNSHYLKSMTSPDKIAFKDCSLYDSVLISGGYIDGISYLPLQDKISFILSLPERLLLNVHPGFQDPKNLLPLVEAGRKILVSFDLPASEEVVKDVLKLPFSLEYCQNLLKEYTKLFDTVVHITCGLTSLENEKKSIDFLASLSIKELVVNVYRPTPNTQMAAVPPPALEHVVNLIQHAYFNSFTAVTLGCMRPSGQYRTDIDFLAWLLGVDKIVMPSNKLVDYLKAHDVEILTHYNCCALT